MDENRIAGAVALVLRDGQPVYERAVGWSDKEAGRRMTTDTIFRIASQTKAITSAAILSLVEEGKIGLNDPVEPVHPFVRQDDRLGPKRRRRQHRAGEGGITIRDLLTHTAGISYGTQPDVAALYEAKGLGPAAGFGWYTADKDEPVCDDDGAARRRCRSSRSPASWVYGYNTDILGCVVERASGMPLDEFIRTRITEPLGMKDTTSSVSRAAQPPGRGVPSGADGRITRAPDGAEGRGTTSTVPARASRAAPGCCRRRGTIRDSSR